jgi:hypothetical protein
MTYRQSVVQSFFSLVEAPATPARTWLSLLSYSRARRAGPACCARPGGRARAGRPGGRSRSPISVPRCRSRAVEHNDQAR